MTWRLLHLRSPLGGGDCCCSTDSNRCVCLSVMFTSLRTHTRLFVQLICIEARREPHECKLIPHSVYTRLQAPLCTLCDTHTILSGAVPSVRPLIVQSHLYSDNCGQFWAYRKAAIDYSSLVRMFPHLSRGVAHAIRSPSRVATISFTTAVGRSR